MKFMTNDEHELLMSDLRLAEQSIKELQSNMKFLRERLTNKFRHVEDLSKRALIECEECGVKTLHVWCGCNVNCEAFYCLTYDCEAGQKQVSPFIVEWIEGDEFEK